MKISIFYKTIFLYNGLIPNPRLGIVMDWMNFIRFLYNGVFSEIPVKYLRYKSSIVCWWGNQRNPMVNFKFLHTVCACVRKLMVNRFYLNLTDIFTKIVHGIQVKQSPEAITVGRRGMFRDKVQQAFVFRQILVSFLTHKITTIPQQHFWDGHLNAKTTNGIEYSIISYFCGHLITWFQWNGNSNRVQFCDRDGVGASQLTSHEQFGGTEIRVCEVIAKIRPMRIKSIIQWKARTGLRAQCFQSKNSDFLGPIGTDSPNVSKIP